jgi:chaperonin GroEL
VDALKLSGDEKIGAEIIRKSCEAPLRQLVDNAGLEGAVIVEEVKKAKGTNGYDVASGSMSR